jgi:hypothetical protein
MPAIFDLNDAFVYYVSQILLPSMSAQKASAPQPSRTIRDYLGALDTDQVTLSLTGDVTYTPNIEVANLQGQPEVLAASSFENSASVTNSSVFRQSNTSTASFSTSFTEGVKIGAQTKITTKIPFIASGEVTLSAEGSFSSTQNVSSTDTQTFSVDTTINVPPNSRVEATLMINSLQYEGMLMADVQVGGRLRIEINGDRQTVQIPDLFKAIKSRPPGSFRLTDGTGKTFSFTDSDLARFQVTAANEVLYTANATIDAKFGASQIVNVKQFDLTTGQMVQESTL